MLIDGLLISIVLFSIILGYMRGFMSEILRLFVWVGTVFATYYMYTHYPSFLPQFHPIITVTLLFVIFLIIFKLLHLIVEQLFKKDSLGFINKPLGILFGALRGAALLLVASYPLKSFNYESQVLTFVEENVKKTPIVQEYGNKITTQLSALLTPIEQELTKKA